MVFAECGIGAIILTWNVILLGGEIVFFQALCLLGYCLCPMCVAAMICVTTSVKASTHTKPLSPTGPPFGSNDHSASTVKQLQYC